MARVPARIWLASAPLGACLTALPASAATGAAALPARPAADAAIATPLGDAVGAITATSWLVEARPQPASPWTLPVTTGLDALLKPFTRPSVERVYPSRSYRDGDYGLATLRMGPRLSWSSEGCEPPEHEAPPPASFATASPLDLHLGEFAHVLPTRLSGIDLVPTWALSAPAPAADLLAASRAPACAPWQRVQPVLIGRYGGESATVRLTECDGSVSAEAIDVASVLARPPGAAHPGLPLPLEPDATASDGEWVAGVRLVHPRLLWVLQRIAEAFPRRPLYFISGYRPESPNSLHAKGRAVDLFVMNVPNEDVFRVCRKIADVGCGYYPNNRFVHVDLRPTGSGHAYWVDASAPGRPSEYVDSWPGVVEGGALDWAGQH